MSDLALLGLVAVFLVALFIAAFGVSLVLIQTAFAI